MIEFDFEFPFIGTPAQFGVFVEETESDFAVNGRRENKPKDIIGILWRGHLMPDANPVTATLYEHDEPPAGGTHWRMEIRAFIIPNNKTQLHIKMDDTSDFARRKWGSLSAKMGQVGWIRGAETSQLIPKSGSNSSKLGRPPNSDYERAWDRIQNGMEKREAYNLYCSEAKIADPNEETWRSFTQALRRKAHKGTKRNEIQKSLKNRENL